MSTSSKEVSVGLRVLKFGGTSLGNSDRVQEVASIIAAVEQLFDAERRAPFVPQDGIPVWSSGSRSSPADGLA